MCTLVILAGRDDFPVVVAANRDELYARPARPMVRLLDDPVAAGGFDEAGGGSWFGVTAGGLIVALTNHHPSAPPDPARRSRGRVVIDALARRTPEGVRSLLAGLDPRDYNPFHLVFGDAGGLSIAHARDEGIDVWPVPAGLSVVTNDRLDAPEFPRVARVRAHVDPAAAQPWPALRQALIAALGDHTGPDRPVCVHTELYGTRSASLVGLVAGGVGWLEHADGPPCVTPFVDASALVRDRA